MMCSWASEVNSPNTVLTCWDNNRHHLDGRCLHLQGSDWLAGLLKVDWGLLYSGGGSAPWPFVGHRLIYKWDSVLTFSTEYWLTVHIGSRWLRCRSATAAFPAAQQRHGSFFPSVKIEGYFAVSLDCCLHVRIAVFMVETFIMSIRRCPLSPIFSAEWYYDCVVKLWALNGGIQFPSLSKRTMNVREELEHEQRVFGAGSTQQH